MNEKSNAILNRFPGKKQIIASLLQDNPEFASMCEDYQDCVIACQHWSRSKEPEAQTKANEYSELIQALEKEIVEVMAHADSRNQD
jgi:hypothetical protein